MMSRRLATLTLLVAGPVLAQTEPRLIGITAATPLLLTESPTDCRADSCRLAIPPIGIGATAAGGTAWDATRSAAWVSNGIVLTLVDPTGCRELCAPHRPLAGREIITGLAVDERRGELILTDSTNTIRLREGEVGVSQERRGRHHLAHDRVGTRPPREVVQRSQPGRLGDELRERRLSSPRRAASR